MDEQRRIFFLRSAGVAAAAVGGAVVDTQAQGAAARTKGGKGAGGGTASTQMSAAQQNTYVFFNPNEAAFIEAACERLIPSGEDGPGAREAGVAHYIDRQLAGAWGAGERLYRSGPWHQGTPSQGYQLPFTPAELFRTALSAIAAQAAGNRSAPFQKLDASAQDDFLYALQTGKNDLGGVPANVFFESLWGLTVEGFFSDPVYGGNRDMVGWKMIGFPGAYASYYQYIDHHGVAFEGAPISLADNGRGVVHLHPDIPATGGAVLQQQPANQQHKGGH
jgi:gluconate 2-dehydrogenase gamma chain